MAVLSVSVAIAVTAEDLPIDITAIGRQEAREGQMTRVGANLFTDDANRVSFALAEQVRLRQAITSYLFAEIATDYTPAIHIQILTATSGAALFAQPNPPTSFTPQPTAEPMSIWIIMLVIAACAVGGFVWALVSAKKKGQPKDVY